MRAPKNRSVGAAPGEPSLVRRCMTCLPTGLLLTLAGCLATTPPPVTLQRQGSILSIRHAQAALAVSLSSPRFVFDNLPTGQNLPPRDFKGALARGEPVLVSYAPVSLGDAAQLEVTQILQWSKPERVLRKWARFRLLGVRGPSLLKEVILDELPAGPPPQAATGEQADLVDLLSLWSDADLPSYPALLNGFFAGIEFPIAATRVENAKVVVAHRPGLLMQPGQWYESRKAVYGVAPVGHERLAFQGYIAGLRPGPAGLHVNYNSWWTSPVPYSEANILEILRIFRDQLYSPHHVAFDTFCIDLGWSNPRSLWEIDGPLFPKGFAGIQKAAALMNCHLGLWVSPSSCYPPALDNAWAEQQGYETITMARPGPQPLRRACLGGRRYRTALRDRLVQMATQFGVRHFKFDGYRFSCPQTDHGHAPGPLSCEAVADGLIDVFQALRRAAPDVWLETTCFGWKPSPWWLLYANSVIGTFGDDAPQGRVPAPVYRESYTTARDYFNLQGACYLPIPPSAQEVLGIIHQTPEPFLNDAVMTVLRGHAFLPVYLNPAYMNDARWAALAKLLTWARDHAGLLADTQPLLPAAWSDGRCPRFTSDKPMPRQPYGYFHWQGDRGLVALRNPWIAPQSYTLILAADRGVPTNLKHLDVLSLYPEARVYAQGLRSGDRLDVPVAPYETLVLSIARGLTPQGLPPVNQAIGQAVQATALRQSITRVAFEGPQQPFGPDWTSPLGKADRGLELELEADVRVNSPVAELLVLVEADTPPDVPFYHAYVNQARAAVSLSDSATGWSASGLASPEHWVFLRTPLSAGANQVRLQMIIDVASRVSAWAWARKPGAAADDLAACPPVTAAHNAPVRRLPAPEELSLDATKLLEYTVARDVPPQIVRKPRPLERIDGVFLDTVEPESVSQGWGTLQKNKSVWEKPMTIAGKRYHRGLGTHAPSRITYRLDGRYRRFHAWVGADSATNPTVTFEVWLDAAKRWESGLMTRNDPAKEVNIDLAGAHTLELVVTDGGNNLAADHANWADAKLLRQ